MGHSGVTRDAAPDSEQSETLPHTASPMMHLCRQRILSVREWQPYAAVSDGVQHSQLPAGRHKLIRTEVCEEALPKGRRLEGDTPHYRDRS